MYKYTCIYLAIFIYMYLLPFLYSNSKIMVEVITWLHTKDLRKLKQKLKRRDIIKAHAESLGESVNSFINRAIDSQIERDSFARASDPATAPGAASLGGNADNVSGRG